MAQGQRQLPVGKGCTGVDAIAAMAHMFLPSFAQSVTRRATCSHPQGQASTNNLPPLPSLGQHTLVCLLVLGMAMASALWVPNIEFIFGLTGATASVLIAYILPAIVFIRLLGASPELDGSSKATMVSGGCGSRGSPGQVLLKTLWLVLLLDASAG